VVAMSLPQAHVAIDAMLDGSTLGVLHNDGGARVVIEEFLAGEEASFIVMVDGEHVLPLATSQDHKRLRDDDEGPNTGGMGAYSPAPVVTPEMYRRILHEILVPLLAGLKRKNIRYRGVIYIGLMITPDGPKVLEFNARFGDPECQPVMMRLRSDLVQLMQSVIDGTLDNVNAEWYEDAAVCVVLAAGGYPGSYEKGREIRGLEKLRDWSRGFVFHAGSTKNAGRWVTSGGRVLGVTARGKNIADAVQEAYRAVGEISWDGMHYRKDIARRALGS